MVRRLRNWLALGFVLVCLLADRPTFSQRKFPIPRAEREFTELLAFVDGWGSQNQGDVELFRHWALPFGPLDLQVTKSVGHNEASTLKNMYLGVAGAAFRVDAARLANSFHCGPACTSDRRDGLVKQLPSIERLVTAFRGAKGISIIANWGVRGEYRVNNLYKMGDRFNVTRASPVMGFVPSGTWVPIDGLETFLATLGSAPRQVQELIADLNSLSVAAVVREPDGAIRVVRVGISDNESGLYFAPASKEAPKVGESLRDGRKITFVQELKDGVFFYESS